MRLRPNSLIAKFEGVPTSVLREWVLLAAALCTACGLLAYFETLSPLDALWYDSIIARQTLPASQDIVLITIEPDTLDRRDLSRRTWNAGDSAELLERLTPQRPAAVLLDIAMAASDPRDPQGEEALSAAIRSNGKVVLPISLRVEGGRIQGFRLPIAKLANFSSELGHDKAISIPGGVMRRIPLSITNGDISWDHVVLALLRTAHRPLPDRLPPPTARPKDGAWAEDQFLHLRFIGAHDAFPAYTARQVLNGEVAPEAIRDRLILIGSRLADTTVAVPGSWRSERTLWGLEVLANAINTLRAEAWPTVVPPARAAFLTVSMLLLMLIAYLLVPERAPLITLLAIGGASVLSWSLLSLAGIWIPAAAFAMTAALAYPLWAWRRLAATQRFVTLALQRMHAEPGVPGARPASMPKASLIDRQLMLIEEASAKLREAEAQREELLRFLSHDMRSPLASILALIELRRESADHSSDDERFQEVRRYARHTLSLAEEFLQLAYANSSKPFEFELIDLIQALELGVDLVRPLAGEQQVRLQLSLPETAVIRGNHNLVGRMVANLVHNAVKFTPAGGSIQVSLVRVDANWVCTVRDDGEGIAAEDLPGVFQPYRRVSGDKRKGVGLGLAFVQVVVQKHGGSMEIRGAPGRGTEVVVSLPAIAEEAHDGHAEDGRIELGDAT